MLYYCLKSREIWKNPKKFHMKKKRKLTRLPKCAVFDNKIIRFIKE